MKILVTGGFGFIGSAFIRSNLLLNNYVINIDKVTYASSKMAIKEFSKEKNIISYKYNICDKTKISQIINKHKPEIIINFAAESHVDQSIDYPDIFIKTNVFGTLNLLNIGFNYFKSLKSEKKKKFKFIQVSTDEVFGSLKSNDPKFTEKSNYKPNSPYSSSKASSDHLSRAWYKTYKMPVIITHCSNNFGPYQNLEKLIPNVIIRALQQKPIQIYGRGNQIRDWIFVEDHVDALNLIIQKGKVGQTYNIGGGNEFKNIDIVKKICIFMDKLYPKFQKQNQSYLNLITYVKDRPAHDQRYAINSSKIKRELKWRLKGNFNNKLYHTIKWYVEMFENKNFSNKDLDLKRLGDEK